MLEKRTIVLYNNYIFKFRYYNKISIGGGIIKDWVRYYKDVLISLALSALVMIFAKIFDIENKYIDYVLTNFIPISIPMFTILFKNPKFYMKFIYFKMHRNNVEFKYVIEFQEIGISDENEYVNFIRLIEDEYRSKGSQVRCLSKNIGEFVGRSVIMINTVEHDFYYDFENNSLLITVEAISTYKGFFYIIEKLTQVLNETLSKSTKIGYDKSSSSLTIKFIDDESYNLSNPIFQNIYREFNPRVIKLNYDVNNTNIELTNDSIILKSKDYIDMNKILKSQFKFFDSSK